MGLTLVVGSVLAVVGGVSGCAPLNPPGDAYEAHRLEASVRPEDANVLCGPHSIYMLMRLLGVAVDYEEVRARIHNHPQGMSLLEIRQCCADLGVRTEVRRCAKEELRDLRYPVIVHIYTNASREVLHYMVITRLVDDDRIELIDGTDGRFYLFYLHKMDNVWDGYVHGRREVEVGVQTAMAETVRSRMPVASALGLAFVAILASQGIAEVHSAVDPGESEHPFALWRRPEYDGLNCLFLQLRVLGYSRPYETFLRETERHLPVQDMKSMAELGRRMGSHPSRPGRRDGAVGRALCGKNDAKGDQMLRIGCRPWRGVPGHAMIACCLVVLPSALVQAAPSAANDPWRDALQQNADSLNPISVSWSQQFVSQLTPQETMARLEHHMPPEIFFFKASHRVVWQDGRVYTSEETATRDKDAVGSFLQERAFDGKIWYGGFRYAERPTLFKEFMAEKIKKEPRALAFAVSYFQATGLRIPPEPAEWAEPRATSEVLHLLTAGGELQSVGNAELDGRQLVRVQVLGENPIRRLVDKQDPKELESYLLFSPDPPDVKRKVAARAEQQRRLPARQRYVFYLDPGLHYAVRRWEHWYEPKTLLLRCDSSEFEELPGRRLWLPRKCKIDYYSFSTTLPGTFFETPFLSEVFEVSEFRLQPVPPDQFVLVYTAPGTQVNDATLPEANLTSDGYVRYTIPASPKDLDSAIEDARTRLRDPDWSPPRRSQHVRLLVVVNVVALACVAAYLIWRRVRRVPQRTP